MKNSLYKYDRRVIDGLNVTDYTSIYYGKMLELFKSKPDYFMTYEMQMDEKLEGISYKLYKSENYADIILAANNDVFLWNMFYNSDIIMDQVSSLHTIIKKELDLNATLTEDALSIFDNISVTIEDINSKRKSITVPKPEKLNALISLIDKNREDNRITLEES